jgi:hypothetical protein
LSRLRLFVFVEGRGDRYFVDRLCRHVAGERRDEHEVRAAMELPEATGGKQAVLNWFMYLRRRRLLSSDFKGKRWVALFLLDKDVDDYTRSRRRSPHVVYTEPYQIENYYFQFCDLHEVAAAASGLDRHAIAESIGDPVAWRRDVAERWHGWIVLCLAAQLSGANVESNYGVKSRINEMTYGAESEELRLAYEERLARATGWPSGEFREFLERVGRRVARAFARGRHDAVFKGKWYAGFLLDPIDRAARGRAYATDGLENRLVQTAMYGTEVAGEWAAHLRLPVERSFRLLEE